MKPRFNFRLAGGLLGLSALAIIIFRIMKEISLQAYIAAIVIYSVVSLFAALKYISINQGILGKISYENLPSEWSEEQKEEFLKDRRERRQRSKWALILLTPMIATFFFEALDIYVLQGIIQKLGSL
jgi:hypothetical protein